VARAFEYQSILYKSGKNGWPFGIGSPLCCDWLLEGEDDRLSKKAHFAKWLPLRGGNLKAKLHLIEGSRTTYSR